MKTKKWRKMLGSLLACLLLAALLPTAAMARGLIDTGKPVSLTVRYPCKGITFRLYRVAEVSAYGEYTLTGDFQDDPVTLKQPDQAGWRAGGRWRPRWTATRPGTRGSLWPPAKRTPMGS